MKSAWFVTIAAVLPAAAFAADLGASGPNPDFGMPIGTWLLYPQLFAGAVFNDNVFRSSTDKMAELGLRLTPSFQALRDDGIQKTTVYGAGDFQFYRDGSAADTFQGRAGVAHAIEFSPDLVLRGGFDFTRSVGLSPSFTSNIPVFVTSANTALASGQPFNQWTGSLSVEKRLTQSFFVVGTGSAQRITYDDRHSDIYAPGQNGTAYSVGLRGGYWVGPVFNVFVEPSLNWRNYDNAGLDNQGYRVVGGVASDQIGLFKGEVFGGYQRQSGARDIGGYVDSPVLGGRVYYYPTEYLTFALSADESTGAASGVNLSQATYTRNQTVQFTGNYAFSPYWSANGRLSYARTRYINVSREDSAFVAGGGVSYNFWRNIAITLDAQHTRQTSNVEIASYSQNLYTLGATYRY